MNKGYGLLLVFAMGMNSGMVIAQSDYAYPDIQMLQEEDHLAKAKEAKKKDKQKQQEKKFTILPVQDKDKKSYTA